MNIWHQLSRRVAVGRVWHGVGRRARLLIENLEDRTVPTVLAANGPESLARPNLVVVLQTAADQPVTVKYALAGGTATKGADFALASGALTFAPGERAKAIPLTVVADAVPEADETVQIKLTGPRNAALGVPSTLTYTIQDDDPPPDVGFEAAASLGTEGGKAQLVVKLSAPSGRPVAVGYATMGGTAAAADHTLAAGTVTFKPGETTQVIKLPTTRDRQDEADETVVVTLSAPAGATLGAVASHTFTIRDADKAPTVAFGKPKSAAPEGAGVAALQVKLSAPSGLPVTVDYAATGGTAAAGTDFQLAAGTITFQPGETVKDIPVTLLDNAAVGGEPRTVVVTLSAPGNATLGTKVAHTLSIADDDPNVRFERAAAGGPEGAGTATVRVILSADHDEAVTVRFTVDGTATGADHTLAAGSVTFAPHETTKDILLSLTDDAFPEGDETVRIRLSAPRGMILGVPAAFTYTIQDDDPLPTVGFAAADSAGPEGAKTAVEVKLSAPSGRPVTVAYAVTAGAIAGSDYRLPPGTVTFEPGETIQVIKLATLKDKVDEADESLTLTLAGPGGATLGTAATHTHTIADTNAPPNVGFAKPKSKTTEGAGVAALQVKLSAPSGLPVTVDYAATGGTAAAGTDFDLPAGTLTFAPGETVKDVPVTLLDNTTVGDGSRSVVVTLSAPGNATLGNKTGHTLTINEDDPNVVIRLATSPIPDLLAASDTGVSPTDNVTKVASPTVRVPARPGDLVRVFVDGVKVRETTAEGPAVDIVLGPLADGPHTVTATVNDLADTLGVGTAPLALTIDTVLALAPAFDLAVTSDTGAVGDQTTAAGVVTLVGRTDPSATLTIQETGQMALASNRGVFKFPHVALALGANARTVRAADPAGNTLDFAVTLTREAAAGQQDPVLRWTRTALDAIALDASAPPVASRALAMVAAAVYDTVNSLEGTPGYYVAFTPVPGNSAEAAVSAAAHRVLSYLYPAQTATFDAVLAAALAGVPAGASRDDGLALGEAIGDAIVALRTADGWDRYAPHVPGTGPGVWHQTAPMYAEALLPQWADLAPFAMSAADQFRPVDPPPLDGQAYADAVAEVQALGSATSPTRTADQTQVARFWADGAGTYTPPGHWNVIAADIAEAQGLSTTETALLFAELNVALGDAAIAAWDAKYHTNFWRPVEAIRNADADGNTVTTADPAWTPLLTTPPFPSYTSGHSTFSGAAAAVLTDFFGSDFAFTATSPAPALAGVTRSYTGFDQAAVEAGMSRIYGGIHFQFDNEAGLAAGRALADHVLDTFSTTEDVQAPRVLLQNLAGAVVAANVPIAGRVIDALSGVATLKAQVDAGPFADVPFGTTGLFAVPTAFPVDGSADGTHTVQFVATDAAGNQTPLVEYAFTLDTRAPTLGISSPTNNGTLAAGARLSGIAVGTGSAIATLTYQFDGGAVYPLAYNTATGSFDAPLDLSPLSTGGHTLTVFARDAASNTITTNLTVTLPTLAPFVVTEVTPAAGAGDVGLTFRPKVEFSRPVNPATLTASNFFATDTTGAPLPATIVPADDGTFAWLFLTNPMPGASTVSLAVDGSTIQAADGSLLDAAGTGTAGSKLVSQFTTVGQSGVSNTTLTGILADPGPDLVPGTIDDVKVGPDGVLMTGDDVYLKPIAGSRVFIFGHEAEAVTTDAAGRFTLTNVPTGSVKLVLEGIPAGQASGDFYFPEMVMDLAVQPGVVNTVMGTMGTTEQQAANRAVQGVYLPRIRKAILRDVNVGSVTRITADAESAPNLTPEQRSRLFIDIPADSLVGPDGQKLTSGKVGISTVPAMLVREMLPPGVLQHTFDITIQAPGIATFSKPAFLSIPNVFNMLPGTRSQLLSFDHTTGRLVLDGTMTVTPDGLALTTDPGTGVTHPGWHGGPPPGSEASGNPGEPCPPDNQALILGLAAGVEIGSAVLSLTNDLATVTSTLLDAASLEAPSGLQKLGAFFAGVEAVKSLIDAYNTPLENGWSVVLKLAYVGQAAGKVAQAFISYNPLIPGPVKAALSGAQLIADKYAQGSVFSDGLTNAAQFLEAAANTTPCEPGNQTVAQQVGAQIAQDVADLSQRATEQSPKLADLAAKSDRIADFVRNADLDAVDLGYAPEEFADFAELVAEYEAEANEVDQAPFWGKTTPIVVSVPKWTGYYTDPRPAPGGGGAGGPPNNVPACPLYWVVDLGTTVLRGRTSSGATPLSFFAPPGLPIQVWVYDPTTKKIGSTVTFTRSSGTPTSLGNIPLLTDSGTDADVDGLSDRAEHVVGTNAQKWSTVNDGISDGAKLAQCLDPLNGQNFPTGLIANLPLAGQAKALTLSGSTLSSQGQTAYVATGTFGLAVVNASSFKTPVLLGQVALGGDATDVDVDENLQLAAVAANTGGLKVVDVSAPTAPAVLRTVNVGTGFVRVKDGIAYAAVGPEVRSYDLLTGELLEVLALGTNPVRALARDGNYLYSLDAGNVLRAIDISGLGMAPRGSLTMPAGGGRLFVGNDVAYVGAGNGLQEGFATVNVSNPNGLTLVSGVDASNIAGQSVVANGTGLAVAVGAPLSGGQPQPALDVVDVSNPANTGAFITRFNLPATPYAVALGSGIAFVATGTAGLQVANYKSFDAQGIAPAVTISLPAGTDVDPGTAGTQVTEGVPLAVLATTSDDVQVRNVELLVDGRVARNAVALPYNLATLLPSIAANGSDTVTLQARATDTGGNVGVSNALTVQLVLDSTAPTIVSTNVPDGATRGSQFRAITVNFSEPMDTATLVPANFTLTGPGGPVTPTNVQYRRNNGTVQLTFPPLALGGHTLTIHAAGIKDRAGNAVGTGDVTSTFTVSTFSTVWVGTTDGFWDNPANWDNGVVPGFNDDVLIDAPGTTTVTIRSGNNIQVRSLISNEALTLTGGTMSAAQTIQVNNTFTMQGGTLKDTTVLPGAGGQGITFTNSNSTLDGLTVDADLDLMSVSSAHSNVKNGLRLNGTARLGNTTGTTYGRMYFNGAQTLGGTGSVLFGSHASNELYVYSPYTLTIGPNVTVRGSGGMVNGGGTVVNQATIRADASVGAEEFAYDAGWAGAGSTVFSTASAIDTSAAGAAPEGVYRTGRAANGSNFGYTLGGLTPGGTYTIRLHFAELIHLAAGQGRFHVGVNGTQVLTNFDVFAAAGARFKAVVRDFAATADAGGLVQVDLTWVAGWMEVAGLEVLAGAAPVLQVDAGNAAGSGISINATTFTNAGALQAADGRGLSVGNLTGNLGNATLSGTGTTLSVSGAGYTVDTEFGLTDGQRLTFGGTNYTVDEDLTAQVGTWLTLNGTWTNAAGSTIGASGANLTLGEQLGTSTKVWTNLGTISAVDSTVGLGGAMTLASLGTFARSGGAVNLTGALDNTGTTVALDAGTGSWVLGGGTIKGGTHTATGGNRLVFTGSGGTLDGLTVDADLDLTGGSNSHAVVKNGLTLNGTARLGNTSGTTYGRLYFNGTQTLGGAGTILFGSYSANELYVYPSYILTIGPNVTVRGSGGSIEGGGSVTLQGSVLADRSVGAGEFTYDAGWTGAGSTDFSTGSAIDTSAANAAPADVYKTARAANGSNFGYALGGLTPGNSYTVRLHFAEQVHTVAGQARFHVGVNGTQVLTNFDVFAAAGARYKAVVRDFAATADGSGRVQVDFTWVAGWAHVAALEILSGATPVLQVDAGNLAGMGLTISPTAFTNQGAVRLRDGIAVSITSLAGNLGDVTVEGAGTQLSVGGSGYTIDTPFILTNGQTLALNGTNYTVGANLTAQAGTALTLNGTWTNAAGSTISATNATLTLGEQSGSSTKAWTNLGTISATDSTVGLGGAMTLASLGTFARSGGAVNLTGALDNTGTTLALDAGTGSWVLGGGTIKGGTHTATGGNRLVFTGSGGTLDGLTVDADLDLTGGSNSHAVVKNGLTLNGTARLGSVYAGTTGRLYFNGTQTLGGTGTLLFGRAGSANGVYVYSSQTLTIGPGITVRGGSGSIDGGGAVVNQGTIRADHSVGAGDFAYDAGWVGGGSTTLSTGSPIDTSVTNAAPAAVYQSVRAANGTGFGYTLGGLIVGNNYTIRLHFADLTHTAPGQGRFHVAVNGTQVLTNFDIIAAAGARYRAEVRDFPATADAGGRVQVDFNWVAGWMQVGGLEVLSGAAPVLQVDAGNLPNATGFAIAAPAAFTNQGTLLASNGNSLGLQNFQPNAGTITAGAGSLITITGAFTQTAAGTMNIDIGGTANSQFGRVNVTGAANLNGTLNLAVVNGFGPAVGQTFKVITWASRSGTFATVNGTNTGNGRTYTLSYNTSDLTLGVS